MHYFKRAIYLNLVGFPGRSWLRALSVCFFVFMASIQSYGQQTTEAIVYNRDGSVYRGVIVEENSVAIEMVVSKNDTLYLPKASIKKIKRDGDYLIHSNGKLHKTRGFFWAINLGFNPTDVFYPDNIGSEHLELLFGWRINKRWSVANGIGSEFNRSRVGGFDIETTFSSFFLYGRYYFTDGRRRLFAYSRLGYSGGNTDPNETNNNNFANTGGINWQGGGGIHFASKRRSRFIISLGYYLQKTGGSQFFLDDFGNEVKLDYSILITRPILKVGIEFR